VGLVGAHLHAPGVGGDAGDLVAAQEVRRVERQAGGVPGRVVAPRAARPAHRDVPGADQDEIAAADGDALRPGAGGELGTVDALPRLEPGHAAVAGDVEQHAPADDLLGGQLDAALAGAGAG